MRRPNAGGRRFWGCLYLVSQQGRHTGLGGVADGSEVVATLEGQHHTAPGQGHQLLGQVPKTCKEGTEQMQGKGRGGTWSRAPGPASKNRGEELHHIKNPPGI